MSIGIAKAIGAAPALVVLSLAWVAVAAIERFRCYRRARLERAQLLGLNERELRDLGLSRVDAIREASKPAWGDCARRPFVEST